MARSYYPIFLLSHLEEGVLQRTLKNYALWKKNSKSLKFGTKSTHFEKKKSKVIFCMAGSIFFFLKISNIFINLENASISSNVLMTILSIVRSIIMGLKNYCWDKNGFASCELNEFLQTRFCQSFTHRRKLFQVVELSWMYWTHRCFRTVHTPRPRKFYPSIPSEHMLYFKEWLMCNEI